MDQKSIWAAAAATLAAAAAIALCGCSSDDEIVSSNYPADNIVRVTAGVNEMATRAAYTTSSLSTFQISINNSANSNYSYYNVTETKNGDSWTPSTQMLWQNASQSVDIIAIAPVSSTLTSTDNLFTTTNYAVSVQSTQKSDDTSSDFLVYKKAGLNPGTDLNTNGAITIPFQHALSQLVITVKFGTEFDASGRMSSTPITDIKVGGTITSGTCDFTLTTPTVSANSGTATDVAPYFTSFTPASGVDSGHETTNAQAEYTCILIPQTIAANTFSVSFTINNKVYTWTSSDAVTLAGGNQYTLDLTVGNDIVVPSANGITAKAWTDGGSSDKNTD